LKYESEGFSSPLTCPPYNPPPYPVEDAKLVIVRFKADPTMVARLVPEPLEPVGDGTVTAFIGDIWQINGPGAYHEGGISIGVRYKGVTGSYMPFLLTSTDDALLVGREVFGMPKLMCDEGRISIDGNARRANLVRRGDEIINLSVNLERPVQGEKLLPVHRFFIKKIASPDPEWPSLRQVIYQQLASHKARCGYIGRGWVKLSGNTAIDLTSLAPTGIVDAAYVEASWDVPPSKVLLEEKVYAYRQRTALEHEQV
jgi:acetoacetate decarboxylase